MPALDRGLGMWALSYDLSHANGLEPRAPVALNLPSGTTIEDVLAAQAQVDPRAVAQTFSITTCGTASQLLGKNYDRRTGLDQQSQFGVRDTLGINVRDTTSSGCVLIGLLPKQDALAKTEVLLWKKIAAHIAAGFRLQRKRAESSRSSDALGAANAILTPGGKLEHADTEAQQKDARQQLRDAVVAMEAARGRLRRTAPETAVEQWKGLVSARWTLLDHVELGGRRYVLARDNAPTQDAPVELAPRERQVIGYAVLGHSNKLIAYELGVADSTVRVLMGRVAQKLGTSTRADTLRAYLAMTRAASASQ
jgi:DNA-binding CsgD family transcriptional regulator